MQLKSTHVNIFCIESAFKQIHDQNMQQKILLGEPYLYMVLTVNIF